MHCIGISTSYFVHFSGSYFSSIHGSDYGIDNLLLGGGLGEVGEGLTALEFGVLDHTWGKIKLGGVPWGLHL